MMFGERYNRSPLYCVDMTHETLSSKVLTSRLAAVFAARPRLMAFLVMMILLIAVQGGVAAETDCTLCAGTTGESTSGTGP